jgi:predicted ATPase with chaperone activity
VQIVKWKQEFLITRGLHSGKTHRKKIFKQICAVNEAGKSLKTAMERLGLSARAYNRILKVSRTVADLANSSEMKQNTWQKHSIPKSG